MSSRASYRTHKYNNKDSLIDLWAKFIAYYTSLVQKTNNPDKIQTLS